MKRLRADVDRLLLYTLGQKQITVDDVREVVGPAALQDDWAMTNAIEAGQAAEALRQLALMFDAGAPAEKILGQLGWLVRTKFPALAPGDVRPAIEALFRTDLDLKRSAGDPRVLIERLIVELCAGKRAAGRVSVRLGRRTGSAKRRLAGDAGGQARLVAAGRVPVNNALAGHLVDERDGLLQSALRARQVVAVDGGADGLEGVAQARTELAVALAVL